MSNCVTSNWKETLEGVDVSTLDEGNIVQWIGVEPGESINGVVGVYLMVTDSPEKPLINLNTGELWGSALGGYIFREVEENEVITLTKVQF